MCLITISFTDKSSEMIEEKRKRRFTLPKVETKLGENTIKYAGSKLFNENAS